MADRKTTVDRQYGDSSRIVRLYLARNPNRTIADIEAGTGLPYATIHEELTKYAQGSHEEPRYTTDGYDRSESGGRPGVVWRLVAEPKSAAKRRLRSAFLKIAAVLHEHPELAAEVVTQAMAVVKDIKQSKK